MYFCPQQWKGSTWLLVMILAGKKDEQFILPVNFVSRKSSMTSLWEKPLFVLIVQDAWTWTKF